MWNVLYLIPTAFFNEKSDHDVKLAKPIVNFIHFWSNKYNHPEEYVMCKENSSDLILPKLCIFFARKRSFFIYLFIYLFMVGGGGQLPLCPPSSCAYENLPFLHKHNKIWNSESRVFGCSKYLPLRCRLPYMVAETYPTELAFWASFFGSVKIHSIVW